MIDDGLIELQVVRIEGRMSYASSRMAASSNPVKALTCQVFELVFRV